MVSARRAAPSLPDDDVVEVQVTAARHAGPRRGGRVVRGVLAPVAFLAVLGLAATSMTFADDQAGIAQTDPTMVGIEPIAISRDLPRPELPAPSVSPSASSSVSASPSPSAEPAPLPTATATSTPTPSPTPTPTPTPSPTPTAKAAQSEAPSKALEKPAPDYTKLGKADGKLQATSSVNVRTGPGTGYDSITTLAEGRTITVTDREVDGWRQVVYRERSGWVKGSYLGKVAARTSSTKEVSSGSDSGSTATAGKCAKAGSLERNLTSRTANVLRVMCAKFSGISSYGGYRPGSGSYHGSGRAIDAMVSGDYGWQVAKWARANASSLGITEVIYQQKIWTAQRSGDGWRGMSDRGSASANHYDHVHISVR